MTKQIKKSTEDISGQNKDKSNGQFGSKLKSLTFMTTFDLKSLLYYIGNGDQ